MSEATPPELAHVRPGEELDWEALEAELRRTIEDLATDHSRMAVLQFPNGSANLTYLLRDRKSVV